jgi:hypothetical protein
LIAAQPLVSLAEERTRAAEEIDCRVGLQPGLLVCDPPAQYRPRHPERTTVYQLSQDHFGSYVHAHEERFEPRTPPPGIAALASQ